VIAFVSLGGLIAPFASASSVASVVMHENSLLRIGSEVSPSLAPVDLAFASVSVGYELLEHNAQSYVAKTNDGGHSWRVTSSAMDESSKGTSTLGPNDLYPSTATTPALTVSEGGTVVAYGSYASVVEASSDEGRTWQRSTLPGSVEDIVASGSTFTALVDGPQLTTGPDHHVPPPPPLGWLYVSDNAGRSWHRVGTLPTSVGPYRVIAQPTAATIYALSPGENNTNDGRFGGLVQSVDGGTSWVTVHQPCDIDAAPRFGTSAEFGATSADALWIVCGDSTGIDKQPITQVDRSSNGGRTWSLVAGTIEIAPWNHINFPGTASVPVASDAPKSVFAPQSAWLILQGPALLVHTTNGGATWSDGAPRTIENDGPQLVTDVAGMIEVRTSSTLWQLRGDTWSTVQAAT
jgi:hypothetical protein